MKNIVVLFMLLMKNRIVMCLLAALILTLGCGKKMTVKKGVLVKIEFKATLEDGTVIDESKEGKLLEFTVGLD